MDKISTILAAALLLVMPISVIADETRLERFDWLGLVNGLKLEVDDGNWRLSYGNKAPPVKKPPPNRSAVYGGVLLLVGIGIGVYAARRCNSPTTSAEK